MPSVIPDPAGLAPWLRLTLIPGLGGQSQRKLLQALGSPDAIFDASPTALQAVIGQRAELLGSDVEAALEAALLWAEGKDHHIVTLADPAYPPLLLEIADPPLLLYVRGRVDLLAQPGLAIVGSRNATPQGLGSAEDFARVLAQAGLPIISGLALGIDAAAHRGALAAEGPTIAVIGTGADRLYPARNEALAHQIVSSGAIVSEFPLGTPAVGANFPRRNRIISGLARGVLVVEAAVESGSLITARLAAEQGREVFAIPGSIHSPVSRGCHRLIKEGAKLVESAQDILEELQGFAPPVPSAVATPAGSPEEERVLQAMGHAPCSLDELSQRSGLTADVLLAILMGLELEGRVAVLPGNCYQPLHLRA
ncbi:MAG: DNA-processing protein DprA [Azovibrio sp.]|uniref:DNA-processing protein DprA n=1 Tax=Azovibrio sp. TaxID=1872673 RepID=UPI003C76EB43